MKPETDILLLKKDLKEITMAKITENNQLKLYN